MDGADESETGSANLWSGPRKRAGRFSGHLAPAPRVGRLERVEARDEQVLFETLFDIRDSVTRILQLLIEDDDEEEDEP